MTASLCRFSVPLLLSPRTPRAAERRYPFRRMPTSHPESRTAPRPMFQISSFPLARGRADTSQVYPIKDIVTYKGEGRPIPPSSAETAAQGAADLLEHLRRLALGMQGLARLAVEGLRSEHRLDPAATGRGDARHCVWILLTRSWYCTRKVSCRGLFRRQLAGLGLAWSRRRRRGSLARAGSGAACDWIGHER